MFHTAPSMKSSPTSQGDRLALSHAILRRAHENKGILEKLEKEKTLLKRELWDRVRCGK